MSARHLYGAKAPGKWPPEFEDLVWDWWKEGVSALLCAERLAERGFKVTRNAVIGKITRLRRARGLLPEKKVVTVVKRHSRLKNKSGDKKGPSNHKPPSALMMVFADKEATAETVAGPDLVIPMHERKTLLTKDKDGRVCANDSFTHFNCHWPIGEVGQPDFHYCGKNAVPGVAYCEFHARRMYQPPAVRRRADEPLPVVVPVLETAK